MALLSGMMTPRLANAHAPDHAGNGVSVTGFVVTKLSDSGTGSLREEMKAANAVTGPSRITFNISGTILLSSTLPAINRDVMIDGIGHAITISGNNAVQVMIVPVTATLHLQSITIANGISNTGCQFVYSCGGGDCVGGYSGGHNLIQRTTSNCYSTNGINGNIIGVDPRLGPLANNGGSTLTFAPLPGSPAINAGDNASCPPFDQRGVARPQGGVCDIGAVESLSWPRVRLLQVMR